jgi:hypothetical protein
MDIQQLYKSKAIHGVIFGTLIVIGAVLVFKAGVEVGRRKAMFIAGAGENYFRVFNDPHARGFFGDFMHDNEPGGHGAAGTIVRIALPTIVIADRNNTEKSVMLEADTQIREFMNVVAPEQLAMGDVVVVLGSPDDQGVIDAKLIRVLPSPPSMK